MKIIALSDIHGQLPLIVEEADVCVLAGDWSPLSIQSDYHSMMTWIRDYFLPWISRIKVHKFIFIPGNHDFVCENSNFIQDFNNILDRLEMRNKVEYLCNSTCRYESLIFHGIPYVEHMPGWAFSVESPEVAYMPCEADILLVHQAPSLGCMGISLQTTKVDYGSVYLTEAIRKGSYKHVFCGHIHSGSHIPHVIRTASGVVASLYNVSYLDENHKVGYSPTIIEI